MNIIPSSTGAAKAVGSVLPQLKARRPGLPLRCFPSLIRRSTALQPRPPMLDPARGALF